jgi:hypothetical protein
MNNPRANATTLLRILLDPQAELNGIEPDDCGEYAPGIEPIYQAHTEGGPQAAIQTWRVIQQKYPDLAALLYGEEQNEPEYSWRLPLLLQAHGVGDFPTDALPEWLRNYITGVAAELEVDPGAVALLSLSVLANIYQGRYKVGITTGIAPWDEPLSLWTLFTAEPGERKSAVIKALTRPLLDYQKEYNREIQARYEYTYREHNEKKDGVKPPPPQPIALAMTDTTQEALIATLQEQHERAGIFSSEGNSLLAVHLSGAYRSGAADVSLLNAAWSGDTVDVSRKRERQRYTIYEPAVSVGVCIQPGVLSGASANRVARASGFLSRWLYCCPDSKLGQRTHAPPELSTDSRSLYIKRLTAMLEEAFPMEYPPPEPEVKTMSLDPPAYAVLKAYQRRIEPHLSNTSALVVYRDWYAKAPGQAVRVAALLTLADGQRTVTEAHMHRGVAIVEWSAAHMQRAYNISSGEDTHLAERALFWMRRKNIQLVTVSAIRRALTISTDEAEDVVGTLIDHGYIREIESKRRTIEYAVHPSINLQKPAENTGKGAEYVDTSSQSGILEEPAERCRTRCREAIRQQEGQNLKGAEREEKNLSSSPISPAMHTHTQKLHDVSAPSPNRAPESEKASLHPSLQVDQELDGYTAPPSKQQDSLQSSAGNLHLSASSHDESFLKEGRHD